jgi:hypothetical protein
VSLLASEQRCKSFARAARGRLSKSMRESCPDLLAPGLDHDLVLVD